MADLFNIGITGSFSFVQIVVNLSLALVLSSLIAFVYKKTHKGLSYSQSFISTLVLISIITTVAIMVIGNNLAIAFGLLGAFSIIRFRTAVKETRDTGFVFFALVEGLAVGTGSHLIAVVSTLFILLIVWVLYKINFGAFHSSDHLLTFTVDPQKNPPDSFVGIFGNYFKSSMLLNINSKQGGQSSEMVYSVRFIDEKRASDLIKELSRIDGVSDANIISSKADIEY